jgi:hypothetical protein
MAKKLKEESLSELASQSDSQVDLVKKLQNSQDYFYNSTSKLSNDNFMTNDHQVNLNKVNSIENTGQKQSNTNFNVSESMNEPPNILNIENKINIRMPSNNINDLISRQTISKNNIRSDSIQVSKKPIIFQSTSNIMKGIKQKSKSRNLGRDEILKMYRKSVRNSFEQQLLSRNLMNKEDIMKEASKQKRRQLIRSHTIDRPIGKKYKKIEVAKAKSRPRLTQTKFMGMINGFNQMVKVANRQLESKNSLGDNFLNELPTKIVKVLTKKQKKKNQKRKKKSSIGSINTILKR